METKTKIMIGVGVGVAVLGGVGLAIWYKEKTAPKPASPLGPPPMRLYSPKTSNVALPSAMSMTQLASQNPYGAQLATKVSYPARKQDNGGQLVGEINNSFHSDAPDFVGGCDCSF